MPSRPQPRGVVEGADMEMCLGRPPNALAGQRRAAFGAEASNRPAGGRLEFADLAFDDAIGRALEIDKDGDRRAAVFAAALAMAPVHSLRLARGDKAHRAAQATAFELLGPVAHGAIRRARRCSCAACRRPPSTDAPCRWCP